MTDKRPLNKDIDAVEVTRVQPNVIPIPDKGESDFSTIRQGTGTNHLAKISTLKNRAIIDQITGTATIDRGNFTISISNFTEIAGFKTTTHQLLDALIAKFTDTGATERIIKIPLKEYMELRGLKDKKTARKQVNADIVTLYNASISFTEKVKGKPTNYLDIRIIDSKGEIENGVIRTSFGTDFYELLKGYPIMSYPKTLWSYNGNNNPNSYYFLRRISEHKNMNLGKKNEDRIAVKTLLDATPELPTYEEVKASDRAFTRRIIEPFERDMDALGNTLTWEYCKKNGTPLTDIELASLDHEVFSTLLVNCIWYSYPDKTKRLEKIAKDKAQKAKKANKKKTKGA